MGIARRRAALVVLLTAASTSAVSSGCGETAGSSSGGATTGSAPAVGGAPWAHLVTLPYAGTLRWRCDTSDGEPRFAVQLAVGRGRDTVTGDVALGAGDVPRAVRVDPGGAFDTGLDRASSQTWAIRYRHAIAQSEVHLRVAFDVERDDCIVRTLELRQETERR